MANATNPPCCRKTVCFPNLLKKKKNEFRKQSVDCGGERGSSGGLERPRLRKMESRFEDNPTTCETKPQALLSGYEAVFSLVGVGLR
nr:hypothetical protein Itr_chr01CG16590 [Ipomoea trifida]